ncbi:hypothetical protein TREMEDRAFT_62660 [Tremella mesenterica DSM 1558]|uniref:uncharacterized protein n=1 Tax=Tremella mesenterica (strain ATCC 24925 / CBS 8224 / DSM 1558 / NBRC 9311 / NRRL Y-6157 / RJB 2259-6 / UBC 559-6) TaxID=578456 RepID=UPI0003F49CD3|nr:uncharacterized protein TREMEDRAFT_62660 [Tremella mesenterica DSM 1558]EIW68947.1 hypothetical protein TREMEDRAFT_62660 [Tremella mesenterica DSM 1558]
MVGLYYTSYPVPVAQTCPACNHGLHHTRTRRTAHLCGIPILPAGHEDDLLCMQCGWIRPLPHGKNVYFPGKRTYARSWGSWRTHSRNHYDRRELWTTRFWPQRRWRYRYRWP